MATQAAWTNLLRGIFDTLVRPSFTTSEGHPRDNVPTLSAVRASLRAYLVADFDEPLEATAEAALNVYVPRWNAPGAAGAIYTYTWRDGEFVTIPPSEPC